MRKTICDLCRKEIDESFEDIITVSIEHEYAVADEEYHFHNQCGMKVRDKILDCMGGDKEDDRRADWSRYKQGYNDGKYESAMEIKERLLARLDYLGYVATEPPMDGEDKIKCELLQQLSKEFSEFFEKMYGEDG